MTKRELAKQLLIRIKVIDPDENPDEQEAIVAEAGIQGVYDEWKDNGYFNFPLENIPARYLTQFLDLAAFDVAPAFHLLDDSMIARAAAAEKRIYKLSAQPYDERDTPVVDY